MVVGRGGGACTIVVDNISTVVVHAIANNSSVITEERNVSEGPTWCETTVQSLAEGGG